MVSRKKPKKPIESYAHKDKQRVNNPPVGLVTPQTDPDRGEKKQYQYDPHLDPCLQWAGKAEHTCFEVPTVSLHVHERIDPKTIIEAISKVPDDDGQASLFDEPPSLRDAIDFYKHKEGWSNRLVAGDSLLVMNSLLEKEGMAGKVQMVYIDPPYGIRYGSNFQPFTNKRDVKDGNDEDLTTEPEMIRAFRDTWELGIHSYLTYMRDRLLLARELLSESGSVFVQISDENVHHIREIMDEVFGAENFVRLIAYASTSGFETSTISRAGDYIVWYGKEESQLKYRPLFENKKFGGEGSSAYLKIELKNGERMSISQWEKENNKSFDYENKPDGSRIFAVDNITSQNPPKEPQPFKFKGKLYEPKIGNHWKANYPNGMNNLAKSKRIEQTKMSIGYVRYFEDFPMMQRNNIWSDTLGQNQYGAEGKKYAVQTGLTVSQRCLLMTTDPGDLVFDPTCGSGTTAYVAEQWGRRWITCDTSRVALTLAKQRLLTATFDYYKLAHADEGVGSGFEYKTVPHITLKSIANNQPPATETLYDQPYKDSKKKRVSGPFTVEAVPAPAVRSLDDMPDTPPPADASIARSGETLRQSEWRDELLRTGIRGKAGQTIKLGRIEPLSGCSHLHADAETRPSDTDFGDNAVQDAGIVCNPQRMVVSFGPEHAPLEQRQVEQAIGEAHGLVPKPKLVVFAAFQFDPEAAKDIDETNWTGVTLLKAQMNADLLTDDLRKKRSSNESFWLVGQPDVKVETIADGDHAGKIRVSVQGFDYYNTKTGNVESGNEKNIAMWMLDTDYDGRSLYPRQVFFPMADSKDGWNRLARNLKAEIDEDLIEAYRGSVSLPFKPGKYKRVAVKIVDDRGIESLRIIDVIQTETR